MWFLFCMPVPPPQHWNLFPNWNLKQAWQGSGELMKHKEQLMDSGDLPPSAVTLGTQAVGLFSTEGAARPPIPTAAAPGLGTVLVAPLSLSAV